MLRRLAHTTASEEKILALLGHRTWDRFGLDVFNTFEQALPRLRAQLKEVRAARVERVGAGADVLRKGLLRHEADELANAAAAEKARWQVQVGAWNKHQLQAAAVAADLGPPDHVQRGLRGNASAHMARLRRPQCGCSSAGGSSRSCL